MPTHHGRSSPPPRTLSFLQALGSRRRSQLIGPETVNLVASMPPSHPPTLPKVAGCRRRGRRLAVAEQQPKGRRLRAIAEQRSRGWLAVAGRGGALASTGVPGQLAGFRWPWRWAGVGGQRRRQTSGLRSRA